MDADDPAGVVGVGTMVPGDTERDRRHPGHPGRLLVESER
jgi:hypothetical protein